MTVLRLLLLSSRKKKLSTFGLSHVPQPPRPVAERRPLDLDHIGPEPGQHLRAGRPRLVVREVDDANAFERFGHFDSPFVTGDQFGVRILGKDLVERIGAFRRQGLRRLVFVVFQQVERSACLRART